MATLAYELTGCVDCIVFVANGDIPEDHPELPAEIAARNPAGRLVNADQEGEEGWFSWSPCECCGSTLGGTRGALACLDAA